MCFRESLCLMNELNVELELSLLLVLLYQDYEKQKTLKFCCSEVNLVVFHNHLCSRNLEWDAYQLTQVPL